MRLRSRHFHPTGLRALAALALVAGLAALPAACSSDEPDLVLYCALDQDFAEPLVMRFEEETGLDVDARYDVEQHKTVGLVQAIREEAGRTRCDVFWNNEIAHTVQLAADGLLQAYDSPSAEGIPESLRDPERRWTGFAARARIFIVNTELADPAEITSMWDLVDPRWAGKVGMARPLTGTTLTHMAALDSVLGPEEAERYLTTVKRLNDEGQLSLMAGNAHLMRAVRDGVLAFGWTDTDDFNVAHETGAPVVAVYPDREGVGTMLIPNTIAILEDAPHPEAAQRFVDWVLRPEIERELAFARSAQVPVRPGIERPEHVQSPGDFKVMEVDYARVGAQLQEKTKRFQELFLD